MPLERLNENFGQMEQQAVSDIAREGLPTDGMTFIRHLDVRYAGQGFELRVECPRPVASETEKALIGERFERLHAEVYGHAMPGEALEIVTYRLRAEVDVPKYPWDRAEAACEDSAAGPPEPASQRSVHFPGKPAALLCPVFRREQLVRHRRLSGPAIIEQPDSTTVVPPGWDVGLERTGMILERRV
jgi:N-methylhydantoinase A